MTNEQWKKVFTDDEIIDAQIAAAQIRSVLPFGNLLEYELQAAENRLNAVATSHETGYFLSVLENFDQIENKSDTVLSVMKNITNLVYLRLVDEYVREEVLL